MWWVFNKAVARFSLHFLNSATLKWFGSVSCPLKVFPQHLSQIQATETFILLLLIHSEVDCFTNWWGRHTLSGFSCREQNTWFHELWQVIQVLKQLSSPRPSHQSSRLLPVMSLLGNAVSALRQMWWGPCAHPHYSPEYNPKSLGGHQDVSFLMWDEPFGQQWFAPCSCLMEAFFAQCLFVVESWTLNFNEGSS